MDVNITASHKAALHKIERQHFFYLNFELFINFLYMILSGILNAGLPFAIFKYFFDYSLNTILICSLIIGTLISLGYNYGLFNDNIDRLRNDIGGQEMIEDNSFSFFRNILAFYRNMSGRTLSAHILGVVGAFCWITALGIYSNAITLHGTESYDLLMKEKVQRIEMVKSQANEFEKELSKLRSINIENDSEYQEAIKDRNDGIGWNDAEPRRIMRKIKEDHGSAILQTKKQLLSLNIDLQSINEYYDPLIAKAAEEKTQFNFFAVLGYLSTGGFIAFGLFIAWVISTAIDGAGMSISNQRFVRNRYFRELERASEALYFKPPSISDGHAPESHPQSHPQAHNGHHTVNENIYHLILKNQQNGGASTPSESQHTDTQKAILDLWDTGIRNRSEMARRAQCDRAHVIRTLQRYRRESYERVVAQKEAENRKPIGEKIKSVFSVRKKKLLEKFRYENGGQAL